MKKTCHILKGNKTLARPHNLVFFDTETETVKTTALGKEQKLKLFTAVYYRYRPGRKKDFEQWTHGYTEKDLALFLLSHCRRGVCLYCMSANVWFDIRVGKLQDLLLDAGFTIKNYFTNGKVLVIKLVRERQSIKFINIQNIWPLSVAKIGQVIGLPKLEADLDKISDADLLTYCYRDTEIIYKAMLYWFGFIKTHDLGTFGVTLASQAFNAYRHRFMSTPIAIHNNERISTFERLAYFGGRTECYKIGKVKSKKIYVVDINSQYPYVMMVNDYPTRLKYHGKNVTPDSLYKFTKEYACVAEVDLETDQPIYAKRYDGKTIFPVGRFHTYLCTEGFRHAYEQGEIKRLYQGSVYLRAPIFAKWVVTLYALREKYMKEKNATMVFMIKRLLNSLYGKFGQRADELIVEESVADIAYTSERIYDLDENCYYMVTQLGNLRKVYKEKCKESFHSFPAISAHVTEYARLYLWRLINKAGMENVYYVDTDSLYLNSKGFHLLKEYVNPTKLGALKLEAIGKDFHIYGPKDYVLDGQVKLKGVPKSAEKLADGVYRCDMFPGIKRELQRGLTDHYIIEQRVKTLKREYNKGVVSSDGVVSPFSLAEF